MANIDYTVVQGIAGLIADFKLKDTRFVLANMQVSQKCPTIFFTVDFQICHIFGSNNYGHKIGFVIMFLNLLLIALQNINIWPFYLFAQPELVL